LLQVIARTRSQAKCVRALVDIWESTARNGTHISAPIGSSLHACITPWHDMILRTKRVLALVIYTASILISLLRHDRPQPSLIERANALPLRCVALGGMGDAPMMPDLCAGKGLGRKPPGRNGVGGMMNGGGIVS
jgi:hypothetical protein